MRRSVLVVLALSCFGACGDPPVGVGPGADGGGSSSADAGPSGAADGGAGPGADAGGLDGGRPDAGTRPDAGLDGGAPFDAGVPPDAGPTSYPWTVAPAPPATGWQSAPPVCSSSAWLVKYMHYRRRLRGDGTANLPGFVSIGADAGQSLVAGLRNPNGSCANHWLLQSCGKDPVTNADGFYQWGDGTVWHGWYLQTLATEYAAFKKLGLDTAETESDLGYAVAAFNRLDEAAERVFGLPPQRDGFFMRDDVPASFHVLDPVARTPRFPRNDGKVGYGCVSSTSACPPITAANGSFMSQDQFIEMLTGLALVAKLVPPTVTVRGVPVAQEAKNIVHRVVTYLKANGWLIKDPLGNVPPNQWGGSARSYSYPVARAAERITGTNYEDGWTALNAATWAAADLSWPAQTLNNQSMIMALGTLVDDTQPGGWSQAKLVTRARDWDAPVFPLVRAVLDGQGLPPGVSASQIESMLTTAPCDGPCHEAPFCSETPGWKGEHRFKSPEDRDGDVYGYVGEYPGIDYMLLHNLYVIAAGRNELTWAAPATCGGPTPLDRWTSTGAAAGATFDPWSRCDARDLGKTFCGRSFASWLDAAYRQQATIFVSGGVLQCTGFKACVVAPASSMGTAGDDLFLGSDAVDAFEGGEGADCLYGFGGNDTLQGRGGPDELHGGAGDDTLCGEGCLFTDITGDGDALFGDEGNDALSGGPGIDALYGGEGDDDLKGDQAADTLFGGPGNDHLDGELGDDQLYGGPGNDTLLGNLGDDKLYGGDGRDKLDGQDGDDHLHGGAGDDFLMGGAGKDTLWGEVGADRMCGGCGDDSLSGDWDSDVDACRGEAVFICFTNGTDVLEQCDTTASASECTDAAFTAW